MEKSPCSARFPGRGRAMNTVLGIASAFIVLMFACGDSATSPSGESDSGPVYPMFVDGDADGVNDYVERDTHDPGPATARITSRSAVSGTALLGHGFVDGDGDGICDYAQNGSDTWHGPGYSDADGDGICDCWDEDSPCTGDHLHLRYRDRDRNRVNDTVQAQDHEGGGHGYVDADGDGICDCAQDGSACWHGPGYVDADGDGVCDHWEPGGRGDGQPRGR